MTYPRTFALATWLAAVAAIFGLVLGALEFGGLLGLLALVVSGAFAGALYSDIREARGKRT